MKLKIDDPFVPEEIRSKINELQSLLYHAADKLFDTDTGTVVEGIDYLSIIEDLCLIAIYRKTFILSK